MAIHAFYSFFKTVAPTFFFKMSINIFFQNVSTFFGNFFNIFRFFIFGSGDRWWGWTVDGRRDGSQRRKPRCSRGEATGAPALSWRFRSGALARKEPTAGVAEAPARRPRRRKHERQSNSGRVDEIRIWCDDPTTTRNQLICDRFCMTFSESVTDMLMAHSGLDFGPRLYDRALISS